MHVMLLNHSFHSILPRRSHRAIQALAHAVRIDVSLMESSAMSLIVRLMWLCFGNYSSDYDHCIITVSSTWPKCDQMQAPTDEHVASSLSPPRFGLTPYDSDVIRGELQEGSSSTFHYPFLLTYLTQLLVSCAFQSSALVHPSLCFLG